MKISKNIVASVVVAAALSACGGGGGSAGESHGAYNVTLTADKTLLPLNTGNVQPGIGVYAPFTTTLYVKATENGFPIPGSGDDDDTFGCNVEGGLNTGSLYYLDGDDEHMVDAPDGAGGTVKVPGSYRSITLGSNSGGNSFHFHAGDEAGTATITCSVQNPQDKKNYSTSITITVGAASGKVANVTGIAASNALGTQGNTSNLPTSTNITAHVLDDANQPLANPSMQNLQVSIRSSTGAGAGARLMAGGKTASTLWLSTVAGVANFSLASGPSEGSIVLDMTADRSDNDVTNGIQDPIIGVLVIPAVSELATVTTPPTITTATIGGTATVGVPFSYALEASGGTAPYTWAALSAMPAGLSLSSSGVISGTPSTPGDVSFAVRVTDSVGKSDTANYTMKIGGTVATTPLSIVGCTGDINTACTLLTVKKGDAFSGYALTTSGGATGTAAWVVESGTLPPTVGTAWALSGAGVLSGPDPVDTVCGNYDFYIKATKGTESVTHKARVTVVAGTVACP